MPLKIKKLKASLARAGFVQRSGKGSHTVWAHPDIPALSLTISGKDGDDAKPYQVKDVRDALGMVGKTL
jgi:predicted RNA binding protein YcfA (HicA-like mRNA interferase family)